MRAASRPNGWARSTSSTRIRSLRRDKENRLAFIGNINRVKPQQLAGRLHFQPHRQARFINLDTHIRGRRNLIQRGRKPSPRRIAHRMDCLARRIEYIGNHSIQRRAVRPNLAFELQALAHAHDRHAMIADGS